MENRKVFKGGKTNKRNQGIELLRIVAMFYIAVLHVVGLGGIADASTTKANISISWFIRTWSLCAVNIYALISGYVGYREEIRYKYSKYLSMWLQAVFYGVLGAGVCMVLSPDILYIKHLILAFLPVTTGQWWYFSAYTGLFFLIPFINHFIKTATDKMLKILISVLLIIFSVYPTIASLYQVPFGLNKDYSLFWLIVLYIVGAWMKKCNITEYAKTSWWIIVGVCCFMLTWISQLLCVFWGYSDKNIFYSYLSPTVICMAVAHLIIFSKIRIVQRIQRIICWMAPATFGVYLFHMQWDISENTIIGRFEPIAHMAAWKLPLYILGSAVIIMFVGISIDKLRGSLFSFFRIDTLGEIIKRCFKKIVKTKSV